MIGFLFGSSAGSALSRPKAELLFWSSKQDVDSHGSIFSPASYCLRSILELVVQMSNDAMSVYSQDDDHDPQADELRETSLVTLEALISSCSQQM